MSKAKKFTTIRDVAEAAGVSVSTVSRVLNEKDDVASDTYEKVKQVVLEMGYASNLAARSMRSRKTNVIGLIMPDVETPWALEIMKGVNRAIAEFNYDLLIYTNGDIQKNNTSQKEVQYVSLLGTSVADGVIVVAPLASTFSTSAPVVALDPNKEDFDYPSVIATNKEGAVQAVNHLIELGHTRIAHITGIMNLQSAIRRKRGYEDALYAAGIPIDQDLIVQGDYNQARGYTCGRQLLTMENPPTAIFAANDQTAMGVMKAAEELDISIPEDLSLVGFDNLPESSYLGMTTVEQPIFDMAYKATEILVDMIAGKEAEARLNKLPTSIVIRSSTRAIV